MRVMLVSDFYAPYVGGVEQHVRSLAHALVERGHQVLVVTSASPRVGPGAASDAGVEVARIRTLSAVVGRLHATADRPWAPPIPDPLAMLAIGRLVWRWRPDVVHGHDWLARSAAPWCGPRGPALVTTLHHYTRSCARKDLWRDGAPCPGPALVRCLRCASATYGSLAAAPVVLATRLGERIELQRSRVDVAVSEATAAGNRAGPGIVVVPNPLPPPAAADGSAGLADLELPAEPFLVFVGDQRDTKGFPVLVEAHRRLVDRPPLVVVGERPHDAPASVRVDDDPKVWTTGPVPQGVVQALLRRALVVVVPSVWSEPFGMVAIEAMAAGRPLVASDVGGLSGLVDHGRTGRLVPPGDVDALAAELADLVASPEARDALGRAAAADVGRFQPSVVACQVEAVYEAARRGTT